MKMNGTIIVLIIGLFAVGAIHAQAPEILSNNSIIKMAKAKLSDELIIDEIQSSKTFFDLSDNALKKLASENVSPRVIEAMKIAGSPKTAAGENAATAPEKRMEKDSIKLDSAMTANKKSASPVAAEKDSTKLIPVVTADKISTPTATVEQKQVAEALNYVAPLIELVKYHESEFETLADSLTDWDQYIRNLLGDVKIINNQILKIEMELREKKNADTKAYSQEILALKIKLTDYRGRYKQTKIKLLAFGENITKTLTKIGNEKVRAVEDKYNKVSQLVKSVHHDPSEGETAVSITVNRLKINDTTIEYIAPATEMLAWHQNEIKKLLDVAKKWNIRVKEIFPKDADLKKQLEPLKNKLEEYKSNSEKYKTEIATLKKQRSAVEKGRKVLAKQMEDDSRELAAHLKQISTEIQKSIQERFADIIENINYSFQEKPGL
jgi:hypothetical protein